jgi:hypothetical protein
MSATRSLLLVVTVLLAGFVVACREQEAEPLPATKPLPPAYVAMLEEVAAERGLPAPATLRIGAIPREQVGALLEVAFDAGARQRLERHAVVYRLLGMLPGGMDYAAATRAQLEQAAGALYLPGRGEIWLIREGGLPESPRDLAPWEQRLLAHEFVHALQDYHFDLGALGRTARTIDASLALRALLEGDANWTESRWTANRLLPTLGPGAALEPPGVMAPPPALARQAWFQSGTGTEWVALLRGDDPAAVDRLLRGGGPWATALVLHPELPATGWAPGGVALPEELPGAGWTLAWSDVAGEFLLGSYLQSGLPALPSLQGAAGWAADVMRLYRTPTGGDALALRVRFRDPKEAGEFAARHRELLEARSPAVAEEIGLVVATRRDEVTVVQLEPLGAVVTLVFATDEAAARELARFLATR